MYFIASLGLAKYGQFSLLSIQTLLTDNPKVSVTGCCTQHQRLIQFLISSWLRYLKYHIIFFAQCYVGFDCTNLHSLYDTPTFRLYYLYVLGWSTSNQFDVPVQHCLLWGAGRLRPWWRHQMETFSALLALCAGNSPVPVNSPHKGQGRGALMFSLIYASMNGWVNNREVGDLRRYRGHYDVNVMTLYYRVFHHLWLKVKCRIQSNAKTHTHQNLIVLNGAHITIDFLS